MRLTIRIGIRVSGGLKWTIALHLVWFPALFVAWWQSSGSQAARFPTTGRTIRRYQLRQIDSPSRGVTMNGDEGFHLEEYRQIRAEVIGQLARIEQLFRYSIVVSASVTAWLLTSTLGAVSPDIPCVKVPRNFAVFGWLIAPAFVLAAGLMAAVLMYSVTRMGQYLRRLEQVLGRRNLGWEQFNTGKNWIVTTATGAVWLILFFVCSVLAQKELNNPVSALD